MAASTFYETNFDPKIYRLDPDDFLIWNDYLYNPFGAYLEQPIRRTCVSLGAGVIIYVVGLCIAATIGFAAIYATSPIVYLLTIGLVFIMGRARWLKLMPFRFMSETREAFVVSDDEYAREMGNIWRRITDNRLLIPVFLFALLVVWTMSALLYLAPTSYLGAHLAALEPPTFPLDWFKGPHLVGKMIILDWFAFLTMFNLVHVGYGAITLISGWSRAVAHWPVVPMPAYIMARFRKTANYYLAGSSYTALYLLLTVLAYNGRPDPLLFAYVGFFAFCGLLSLLYPLYAVHRLITHARDQIAAAVSEDYYMDIFPLAAGVYFDRKAMTKVKKKSTYTELFSLHQLMIETNQGSSWIYRFDLLIPAVLSQAIPFLGFLYPIVAPYLFGK